MELQLARIQPAEDQDLFHHAGHAAGVPGDGLQLLVALDRLHSLMEIPEQFRRRLDDAERRAEFMRDHRNKIALELAEFLFPFERFEQFLLGPFALRDVQGQGEHVRRVVDCDGFGGKQNSEWLAAAIEPAAFLLPDRSRLVCRSFQTTSRSRRVFPHAQFHAGAPQDFLARIAQPVHESVIGQHIFFVAHAQDADEHRAGLEGGAEPPLALAQLRLAPFSAR